MSATDYYIANSGKDSNNGRSPGKPFKTIDKINSINLKPGDNVLFKSGDTFTGQLNVKYSGKPNMPIIISKYGNGAKPVLKGSLGISGWEKDGKGRFFAPVDEHVKQLYVNGKLQTIARFPDDGYLRIDEDDSLYIYDEELKTLPHDITGSTLRALTCNWQWEIRHVEGLVGNKMILDSIVQQPYAEGFGYYLENREDYLTKPGEWYYNAHNSTVILIFDRNMGEQLVEASVYDHGILIFEEVSYVDIKDIEFKQYSESGVFARALVSNINITDCRFSQIEVFGINFETAAEKCLVKNNVIKDIRGKAIALLEPQNCTITGNTIKRIGLIHGYGYDGVNNATGITVSNNEFRDENYTRVANGNLVSYNTIDSTGYGGIRLDGSNNIAEYNVVKNAVLTMNDGAGIYCWAMPRDTLYTYNNIIRNNIVINVPGNSSATAGDYNLCCCYYVDNYSNKVTLLNNIAVESDVGIRINDGAFAITLKNNLVYDTRKGIEYVVNIRDSTLIRGRNHVTANTLFLRKRDDRAIMLNFQQIYPYNIGVLDSNSYISPLYREINEIYKRKEGVISQKYYELLKWQETTGKDENSVYIGLGPEGKWWETKDHSKIFINENLEPKIIKLKEPYIDINGDKVNELLLPPFSGKVLLEEI